MKRKRYSEEKIISILKEHEAGEMKRLMIAVHRQTPSVLAEMMPSWRQQYDVDKRFGSSFKGGALNVSGPLVNRSIKYLVRSSSWLSTIIASATSCLSLVALASNGSLIGTV